MTEEKQELESLPEFKDMVWIEDPAGALIARFTEKLRLHVVPGIVGGRNVYLSGVVTAEDSAMQACAFYATDTEYAKQLSYQLGVIIDADFQ